MSWWGGGGGGYQQPQQNQPAQRPGGYTYGGVGNYQQQQQQGYAYHQGSNTTNAGTSSYPGQYRAGAGAAGGSGNMSANSPQFQQYLSSVLSQGGPNALPYSEDVKWQVRQHIIDLVAEFRSLSVGVSNFTHNDGRTVCERASPSPPTPPPPARLNRVPDNKRVRPLRL